MAKQRKDEGPEEFADRLRKLNERTMIKAETVEARRALHAEAERRLLAQFVAGLSGMAGDQVRIQMPTSMDQAVCIAITVTQAEEVKGMRDKIPSRAFGLTVAQTQPNNNNNNNNNNTHERDRDNYRGHGRGRWGYNKRYENGPGFGQRDRPQFSRKGDNVTPGGSNTPAPSTLGRGSDKSDRGIQCFKCHGFGHVAIGCRGGQKGSPLNASGKRATPTTSR